VLKDVDWVLVGWIVMLGCGIAGMLLVGWSMLTESKREDEALARKRRK